MPVRDMRRFAELVRQGDAGMPGRIDLLRSHRTQVMEQMTALEDALTTIDHKIAVYAEALDSTPDADTGGIATMPTLGGQGARL
jgi:hypothetical protein